MPLSITARLLCAARHAYDVSVTGPVADTPDSTRIGFVGTVDGFGWYNNTGAIDVTVNGVSSVPEPMTIGLLASGLAGIGVIRRRKAA